MRSRERHRRRYHPGHPTRRFEGASTDATGLIAPGGASNMPEVDPPLRGPHPPMRTLAEHVAAHGPLSVKNAIGWVLRLAKTVTAMHIDGEVHGALCAEALVIDGEACDGKGWLLAAFEVDQPDRYHSLDREEGQAQSPADDVWALGITLFFALTGKHPYPDGVSSYLTSGVRELPTMAHHRIELEVMQPFMDTLIDPLDYNGTSERFLAMLRGFSPALVDLEGLPIHERGGRELVPPPIEVPAASVHSRAPASDAQHRASTDEKSPRAFADDTPEIEIRHEEEDVGAPETDASQTRGGIRRDMALAGAVAAAALVVLVVAMWWPERNKEETLTDSTPPATSEGTTASGEPAVATGTPKASALGTGSAMPPDPSAAQATEGDVLVCVTPLFPPRALLPTASMDFLCSAPDPRVWLRRTAEEIVRSSDGKATKASIEWTNLGWYQLALLALARGRCCAAPPPATVPVLMAPCKLDEALRELGRAGSRTSDQELVDAMERFNETAHCVAMAGGGAEYGFDQTPGAQQAAIFLRTLKRVAATRR